MLNKLLLKLVQFLGRRELSLDQRLTLSTMIMDNLDALPIRDIIYVNDSQQLIVGDHVVDLEQMKLLREHAITALENKSLALIRNQVAYTAVSNGIHKAVTPEAMLFNRAAIWYHQTLEIQLKFLAQQDLG